LAGDATEGGLWRPANEAEDVAFASKWCVHCIELTRAEPWEDEFGNDIYSCPIMNMAVWGEKPPQLRFRNGEPICTAFREDPDSQAHCPNTMEMFA
jgi:hypothetical protein